jgi:osmotically-inducible protein OsmY
MHIAGQLALTAALAILPLVIGCQMMRNEAAVQIPAAETPHDEALSKSVRNRLLAHKKVDLTGVKVVSSGGTVYLTGTVESLDAREQAIKTAWDVPGVKSVVNTLLVQK